MEQADQLLGFDGCLNFFAGPPDRQFSATINFYNLHYCSHHILGTFGGTTDDMREALQLMSEGKLNPAAMITHIGGLTNAVAATPDIPQIPGMKKLIYTHLDLGLTAIEEFEERGRSDPLFAALAQITADNNGLWSAEAERYLFGQRKTDLNGWCLGSPMTAPAMPSLWTRACPAVPCIERILIGV